jgi:hypothetical protein
MDIYLFLRKINIMKYQIAKNGSGHTVIELMKGETGSIQRVNIYSDHSSIVFLQNNKEKTFSLGRLSEMLPRWPSSLSEYNLDELKYICNSAIPFSELKECRDLEKEYRSMNKGK